MKKNLVSRKQLIQEDNKLITNYYEKLYEKKKLI